MEGEGKKLEIEGKWKEMVRNYMKNYGREMLYL